eukprot:gene26711-biopygen17208
MNDERIGLTELRSLKAPWGQAWSVVSFGVFGSIVCVVLEMLSFGYSVCSFVVWFVCLVSVCSFGQM